MKTLLDQRTRGARHWLTTRGDELRDRLRRVRADIVRLGEPLPRDYREAAIAIESDEVLRAVEESAQDELERIEQALQRIDDSDHAACVGCGQAIEPERLRMAPFATQCRSCAPDG